MFQPPRPTRRYRVAVTVVVDVEAGDQWDAEVAAVRSACRTGDPSWVSLTSTVVARDNGRADFSAELEEPLYDLVERGEHAQGLATYPEIRTKRSWRDDWRRRR